MAIGKLRPTKEAATHWTAERTLSIERESDQRHIVRHINRRLWRSHLMSMDRGGYRGYLFFHRWSYCWWWQDIGRSQLRRRLGWIHQWRRRLRIVVQFLKVIWVGNRYLIQIGNHLRIANNTGMIHSWRLQSRFIYTCTRSVSPNIAVLVQLLQSVWIGWAYSFPKNGLRNVQYAYLRCAWVRSLDPVLTAWRLAWSFAASILGNFMKQSTKIHTARDVNMSWTNIFLSIR